MSSLSNKRMHQTVTPLAGARVAPAGDAQRYADRERHSPSVDFDPYRALAPSWRIRDGLKGCPSAALVPRRYLCLLKRLVSLLV